MIPMVDLKIQHRDLRDEIDAAIGKVLDGGRFVLGAEVSAFEEEVADYLGVKHAVGCASGTDALELALAAGGVGRGDEVITTAFSFAAAVEAILHLGAVPVFVDIDPRTFNIDTRQIVDAITPRTRAVIPVHLFGQPADLDVLRHRCKAGGLLLVEDCAQSFGASLDGAKTGTFGDLACFSFFPSKNLGGIGDGGMVCTASDALAERLRMLRHHGSRVPGRHEVPGYNSRLDELQAAVLRVKLRHVDRYNAKRRQVAAIYDESLSGLPLETPFEARAGAHVYHQYTILCDRRDELGAGLERAGIASAIHYRLPLYAQPAFAGFAPERGCPVADAVAQRCLSLPMYPELSESQLARVVATIASALA